MHLDDHREQLTGAVQNPVTAEDIANDVLKDKKGDVRLMLKKHERTQSGELGEINVTKIQNLVVPDAKTFKSPPLRVGRKTSELQHAEIYKQLIAGVIEPDMSEWATPVLFITKKYGKLHLCIDYRKLNAVTVKDTYYLLRMDECIDLICEAQNFITIGPY